ncbi:MAG: Maf family nucleotide pyrophosphatase [Propionibacteriaceae bacterium]|jgi:septum formation protein|nr:Maf family nucleotide pyrophosphatase [Propionibacteriaceae bacterium]
MAERKSDTAGPAMRFVLASASPARRHTLRQAGVFPDVVVSDVDESAVTAADPAALAATLAELKAESVFARLDAGAVVVVGCDSLLEFEGRPCGKPGSPEAAVALWKRTRGRTAVLVTGHHVVVRDAAGTRRATRSARTVVHFADLADSEIEAYAATGEPERVAGGFTIDGLGGPFVTRLEGDPHNVVGLSLPLLRMMLADLGVAWTSLWSPERRAQP